jgi:sugar/nucleoside kinase (ribokinase family)
MAEGGLDVAGIGNAIVDVLVRVDEAELRALGLSKGVMTLIEAGRAETLYARMGPAIECSGGSAANTIAGIATLGGRAGFMGKVKNDQLGAVFRHDLAAIGVRFPTAPTTDGSPTARCLIFVTADGARTMQTYLGACREFGPDDVDHALVAAAAVTYLEGYLFDPPAAQRAFREAATLAHLSGRKVALSLSDPFCVERHRAAFEALVAEHVDILFGNEDEVCALFRADFDESLRSLRQAADIGVVTRGAQGSVVVSGDQTVVQDAEPVTEVMDTTGAGDLFAAGFLSGWTRGFELGACARLGGIAAADVIGHVGGRPSQALRDRASRAGLLVA